MASKLHELLAVSSNKTGQATKVLTDLTATFGSKQHLFTESLVVFTPITEGAAPVNESQSTLQSTVNAELKWAAKHINDVIDIGHSINSANRVAVADVMLDDGTKLLSAVPATTLLELEKHLANFKLLLAAAPTLDPAKGFAADTARGEGIYKAREVVKSRTAKVSKPLVLAPATDKHPAQVQLITEDVVTGTIRQNEWSGMITPAEKAKKIERLEEVLRAVKAARSRANEAAAQTEKIGKTITDFILG